MWCVRLGYKKSDGSFSYQYSFFSPDKDKAFRYAQYRRYVLNYHWTVEVLRLVPSSVECVV